MRIREVELRRVALPLVRMANGRQSGSDLVEASRTRDSPRPAARLPVRD